MDLTSNSNGIMQLSDYSFLERSVHEIYIWIWFIIHVYRCDKFTSLRWSRISSLELKSFVTLFILIALPLESFYDIISTKIKYVEGFYLIPVSEVIRPNPRWLWSKEHQVWFMPSYYILMAGFSFQTITLFLLHCFWNYLTQSIAKTSFMSRGEFSFYIVWGIICLGVFPVLPFIFKDNGTLLESVPNLVYAGQLSILVLLGIRTHIKFLGLIKITSSYKNSTSLIAKIRYFIDMNKLLTASLTIMSIAFYLLSIDLLTSAKIINNSKLASDLLIAHVNFAAVIEWLSLILIFYPRKGFVGTTAGGASFNTNFGGLSSNLISSKSNNNVIVPPGSGAGFEKRGPSNSGIESNNIIGYNNNEVRPSNSNVIDNGFNYEKTRPSSPLNPLNPSNPSNPSNGGFDNYNYYNYNYGPSYETNVRNVQQQQRQLQQQLPPQLPPQNLGLNRDDNNNNNNNNEKVNNNNINISNNVYKNNSNNNSSSSIEKTSKKSSLHKQSSFKNKFKKKSFSSQPNNSSDNISSSNNSDNNSDNLNGEGNSNKSSLLKRNLSLSKDGRMLYGDTKPLGKVKGAEFVAVEKADPSFIPSYYFSNKEGNGSSAVRIPSIIHGKFKNEEGDGDSTGNGGENDNDIINVNDNSAQHEIRQGTVQQEVIVPQQGTIAGNDIIEDYDEEEDEDDDDEEYFYAM